MTAHGAAPSPGPRLLYVATIAATLSHFLGPYARHFRAAGWRVDAAASGALADPALHAAFDAVHELPLSRSIFDVRGMLASYRALSGLLDTAPDIVHVHTPIASFVTRLAIRRRPRDRRPAVVYTAHGFHFHREGHWLTNQVFRTVERLAGRWTDRLVVINDEDLAAARRHRIVPPARLVHMPGIGLDTAAFSPAVVDAAEIAAARAAVGVPAGAPLIVAVGELNRNKRQADAIAALAAMQHRDAHLVLLGDGDARPRLEALADRLGVAERVRFGGLVPDVRPLLAGATALVHTSKREGLSRAVMEALALEVPVVASAARGNAELVGDSGAVVPIGDVAGLASAMDGLIADPDGARAMGRRGRQRMVERYDLAALIGRHEELYAGLLAERRAAP
jgi:glycosyltransferase involved in cell wall biosynthesis